MTDEREAELLADIDALTKNRDLAVKERNQILGQRNELLAALQLVAGEVTDFVRPTSADSHLPTDIVAVVHAAIANATGAQS